jgi:Flp pilus assembly protein TadD
VLFRSAQAFLDRGAWEQALTPLREATRLEPQLALAHYAVGQALIELGRYAEAPPAFGAAREAFRCPAGGGAAQRAQLDRAIAELRDQVRSYQRERLVRGSIRWQEANRSTPPTMGESLRTLERMEQRLQELERWRKKGLAAREPPEVALALGTALFRSGRVTEAERGFLAALEIDPGCGDAHQNLAVVFVATGRIAEAEREVRLTERAGVPVHPRLREEIARHRPR